jgi:nucleoid DNA-binding protein
MALTKMTQAQLADELADRVGLSRADAKRVLGELEDIVVDNLANCVRTQVAGVTIEPKYKAATKKRMGRNPQTGEEVPVPAKPASVRIATRASKTLKLAAPSVKKLQARL